MLRMTCLVSAIACLGALCGCNQTQEDRTAQQAAEAVHKGNQALRELGTKAKEGAEKAASVARAARNEAAPVLSDVTVTAKVKTALLAAKDVKAMSIDVDTKGGVVTLSGQLPDEAQRKRAMEIAREVDGVKSVDNRLTTPPAS